MRASGGLSQWPQSALDPVGGHTRVVACQSQGRVAPLPGRAAGRCCLLALHTLAPVSSISLLSLHGVRVLGHATARQVGELYGLDPGEVQENLLDAEARGLARRPAYTDGSGWSMTDLGRQQGEQMLSDDLDAHGIRQNVVDGHGRFLPLNERLGPLMTRWQLRPTDDDPLVFNDHLDAGYDRAILRELDRLVAELRNVMTVLAAEVPRFGVHQPRIDAALAQAWDGDHRWVDSPEVAAVNLVWIQLHEDFLATLGITRGTEF